MGNHRFKLSDMMPNAWFYKLRDMSKPKTQNHPKNRKLPPPTQKPPRKSYYHSTESRLMPHNNNSISPNNPKSLDTHFPFDPPRKSSKKRGKRKTIYMPSPRQNTPDRIFQDDPANNNIPLWLKPGNLHFQEAPDHDFFLDQSEFDSFDDGANDGLSSSCAATDIIIDVDQISYGAAVNVHGFTEFDMVSEPDLDLNLPPIVTKPAKNNIPRNKNCSSAGPKRSTGPGARRSVSRPGGVKVKIRGNHGPRTASRKAENNGRRRRSGERLMGMFYSESLAIVKASIDPERDFRDSMLEMIVENNIRASKDLEDLLACYLSLNSNQYHGLIIKAFEQIWFNMPESNF